MDLVNIHCHMLYGVDDGARDFNMMTQMIDRAYNSGVRQICMTPHYNPAIFHCLPNVIVRHFDKAKKYVSEKYPDLKLCLGYEVYYYHDTVEDLLNRKCLTLNGTRNVLVEFGPYEDRTTVTTGVARLLTSGYVPVIAHLERYVYMKQKRDDIYELKKLGAIVQVNASSILGYYGFMTKLSVFSLIKSGLVDIVADDCHNLSSKSPCLKEAYDTVSRKFGKRTADRLFITNPRSVLVIS